jgi:hypothetical protein
MGGAAECAMTRERLIYENVMNLLSLGYRATPHEVENILSAVYDAGKRDSTGVDTDAGMWRAFVAAIPERHGNVTRHFRRTPKMPFTLPPGDGAAFIHMENVEQRELVIRWLDVEGQTPTLDHALRRK